MSTKRVAASITCVVVATVGYAAAVAAGPSAAGQPATVRAPAQAQRSAPHPGTTLQLPVTLHLISQTTGASKIGASHPVYTGALSRHSGKIAGTAAYTCKTSTTSGLTQVCRAAFALKGGIILATETQNISSGRTSGKITGGSGRYAGSHGTVTGHAKSSGRNALTLTYVVK